MEYVSIALGVSISIEQIETILGIVILCVQVLWVLTKGIIAIVKKIKEKRYTEIKDDIDTMTTELNDIKDNVTKK